MISEKGQAGPFEATLVEILQSNRTITEALIATVRDEQRALVQFSSEIDALITDPEAREKAARYIERLMSGCTDQAEQLGVVLLSVISAADIIGVPLQGIIRKESISSWRPVGVAMTREDKERFEFLERAATNATEARKQIDMIGQELEVATETVEKSGLPDAEKITIIGSFRSLSTNLVLQSELLSLVRTNLDGLRERLPVHFTMTLDQADTPGS